MIGYIKKLIKKLKLSKEIIRLCKLVIDKENALNALHDVPGDAVSRTRERLRREIGSLKGKIIKLSDELRALDI